MNFKKGFTLIELLVVVAIIGILASVVLASLNSARAKGADAAIKAGLSNMRAQAELTYDTNSCYTATTCAAATVYPAATCGGGAVGNIWKDPQITAALTAAGNASSGGSIGAGTCAQAAGGGAWAMSVPLKTDPTVSWCIDSTAASKQITGPITTTNC